MTQMHNYSLTERIKILNTDHDNDDTIWKYIVSCKKHILSDENKSSKWQ